MLGQALDPLQTAEYAQARLAAEDSLCGLGLEQFIGGDVEGRGKPDDHVGVEAELAALVIGKNCLDNASAFGEFNLSPAALLAEAGEALSHRFQAGLREFVSGGGPDLASETWTVSPVSANSTRFSPYRSMPVE